MRKKEIHTHTHIYVTYIFLPLPSKNNCKVKPKPIKMVIFSLKKTIIDGWVKKGTFLNMPYYIILTLDSYNCFTCSNIKLNVKGKKQYLNILHNLK